MKSETTQNIKFSIIIPTYNRADLIQKAIQSVIDQTYVNWELIIVDDGSTDHTKEVVESYQNDQILYFWIENHRESYARNYGYDRCSGDFICFLDSDDYLLPEYLEKFQQYIIKNKIGTAIIACGNLSYVQGQIQPVPNSFKSSANPIETYWSNNAIFLHSFILHRTIPKKIRFPEAHYMWEDKYFILEVLLNYPFYYLDLYLCAFTDHPNRSVRQSYGTVFRENATDRINCLLDFDIRNRRKMLEKLSKNTYFKGILQYFYWYASIAMKQPDPKFSLLLLTKMWRFHISPLSLFYTSSILLRMPYFILMSLILPRKKGESRKR